jgi:hypothetical protein
MKFARLLGVCFMVLVLLVAVSQAQYVAKPKTFSLAIGGGYHMSSLTVDYAKSWLTYDEYATFTDELAKVSSPTFGGSFGYFVAPNIEIFMSGFMTSSSKQDGMFSFEVPSMYYYDELAYDEYADVREFSQTDLMFGVKYHIAPTARIDPYIGAGGCYSMAKIQLVSDFYYYDIYDAYYYHSIEIFDPVYTEVKANGFGGFVVGGLEIGITPSVFFYAEGAYKFVTKSVVHPFSEWFETTDEISLNLGGMAIIGGVKFIF